MAQDPVTRRRLDDRFEYPVLNGPSWERLCDGLKYQGLYDHVEIKFTYVREEREETLTGDVQAIIGQGRDPETRPLVKFLPQFTLFPHQPWEIYYWPNRRAGYLIDTVRRSLLVRTPEEAATL